MSDDELIEQLRAELQQAHAQVQVPAGSVVATLRTAHRRRWRRRALAGVAGVAALGVGVAAVSRTGDDDPGTLVSGDGPLSTDAAVVLAAPASVPVVAPVASAAAGVDPPPAQRVDSSFRWVDVTAPAEANAGAGWVGRVPGVVVAPDATVWYTSDAISFEPLQPEPPSGPPRAWLGDGDTLYAAGADAAGGLAVDVSADRGRTWQTVVLPVDPHALDGLAHVTPMVSVSVYVTDAAPLVSVRLSAELDMGGLDVPTETSGHLIDATGVTFFVGACGEPVGGSGTAVPAPCERVAMTWDELGVSPEAAAAIATPQARLFDVSSGVATEVAPPDGFDIVIGADNGLLHASATGREDAGALFRYRGAATWEPVVLPAAVPGDSVPYWTGARLFAVTLLGDDLAPALVTDAGTGPTTLGLTGLFPDALLQPIDLGATTEVLAISAQVRDDAFADGPIEVTSGSVVVRSEATLDWTVVGTDGVPIDGATIEFGAPGSGFTVLDAAGETLATFDEGAYATLRDTQPIRTWVVLTTRDGEEVAADDLADVLAVAGGTIVGAEVHPVGTQLVVTVSLDDGSTRTVRGTPDS